MRRELMRLLECKVRDRCQRGKIATEAMAGALKLKLDARRKALEKFFVEDERPPTDP